MVTFERTHFQYLALVGLVGVYFLYRGVSAPGYTEEASFDLRMKGNTILQKIKQRIGKKNHSERTSPVDTIHQLSFEGRTTDRNSESFANLNIDVNISNLNATVWMKLEQQRRIRHIRDACADNSLFRNQIYKGRSSLLYYYSPEYDFNYCKVPKAGCSFWTQVFTILRKGKDESDKIFGMARKALHTKLKKQNTAKFNSKERRKSQSILVSRDPYSRLFSAFIDKMFLPLFYHGAIEIVKRQRNLPGDALTCANDITFQEFLNDTIQKAYQGRTLNRHWAPIISLCNPCQVNAFALVKQESFSTDVEYALKEIGIAKQEYEVIHDALHDHRIGSTIPGIVQTVLKLSYSSRRCMTKIEVASRIWKSFQIQGYLKDDITFPYDIIDTEDKAKSAKYLSDVILKTIRDNPLTSEESKRQRRRALVTAFKSVGKRTIKYLQDIYKQDFILFDYTFDPPSEKRMK